MQTHEQIILSVRGQHISVDRGVRDLILQLNNLPGVATQYSCQGNDGEDDAYVRFGGPGAFPLLSPLARAILQENLIWRRRHHHVCRGCRSMTVTLEVCGDGIALRWQPWDYRRVVKMVAALRKDSVLNALRPQNIATASPSGSNKPNHTKHDTL